ncbi:MAG TPA: hypothetical protein VKO43_08080, partial [Candidatus Krumholzibacteriaceae bacterium]|nr:hypothetical protein [Candidatus Krumholzibacteriaceae bacterium]
MKHFRNAFLCFLIFQFIRGINIQSAEIPATAKPARQITQKKRYILKEGQTSLLLGVTFIISGTEEVSIDGRMLEEKDYRINTLRGTLVLVEPARKGQILKIEYSRYPFSFPPVMARRFPSVEERKAGYDIPGFSAGSVSGKTKKNPYRFNVSGSKSVGFSVGSRKGLGIDQSMNITLSGKLARDLEVNAFLSDDNLPVQAEGNTEELKRLDKISINIKSRHTEVDLADITTAMQWSEFSSFRRELRGGNVKVNAGGHRFLIGGGITKGRFETVEIMGTEGVQGPYELLPARRFNGVIIIPGSESVYLN